MKFVATRHASDGNYTEHLAAASWREAYMICQRKGWRLDGELIAIIPAWSDSSWLVDLIIRIINFLHG